MPGLFDPNARNQNQPPTDSLTFSQVFVFLPAPRFTNGPGWLCPMYNGLGNIGGWGNCYDRWPTAWDLYSQNWVARIVPGRMTNLAQIIQPTNSNWGPSIPMTQPRPIGNLTNDQLRRVNFH